MANSNGHDVSAKIIDETNSAEVTTAIDDIKAMAKQLSTVERVDDHGSPFEQQTHTLMMESVDRITQQWVGELGNVRDNTKVVEQLVIAQAAKVKDELTKLHLLGVQAMKEAQRGHEVSRYLADELDAMLAEHGTH